MILKEKVASANRPYHARYTLNYVISTFIMSHTLSRKTRERMFRIIVAATTSDPAPLQFLAPYSGCLVQISLLIVTFLFLIPQNCYLCKPPKKLTHTLTLRHVNMWSVTFFFVFFLCHLLNVDACIRHIAQDGQVEWTTLA